MAAVGLHYPSPAKQLGVEHGGAFLFIPFAHGDNFPKGIPSSLQLRGLLCGGGGGRQSCACFAGIETSSPGSCFCSSRLRFTAVRLMDFLSGVDLLC